MKKIKIKKIIVLFVGMGIAMLFNSCATVYNKVPIYFYNTTANTNLYQDGKKVDIGWVVSGSSGDATQTTTYYRKGIKVKRSREDKKMTIERDGKKVDFVLESKFATGTLISDIWFGFGVGLIVDLVAGPLRTYKIKNYDVNKLLGEEPINK